MGTANDLFDLGLELALSKGAIIVLRIGDAHGFYADGRPVIVGVEDTHVTRPNGTFKNSAGLR